MLGANVVVELNSETRARRERGERRQVNRISRTDRTGRLPAQVQEREVVSDAR
jgi:hypothetical protein